MLDFNLKLGGKLEYQDNASLLKFKRNPSIDTYRKSRWKKNLTSSKELLLTTRTSNFARVSENDVNVCKQISSLLCDTSLRKRPSFFAPGPSGVSRDKKSKLFVRENSQ